MIWEVLHRLACDICRWISGHNPRCPRYSFHKTLHYCSSCGEEIYDSEEYIENLGGEYRHYDCIGGMRELIQWLGFEIKTMTEGYD